MQEDYAVRNHKLIQVNRPAGLIQVYGAEFGIIAAISSKHRHVVLGYSDKCSDSYAYFYQSVETVILHAMYSKAKT